ncbi:YafY family protein [Curtobacterium sp. 1P10AnD]|uniref:helix-turn-helix transcriptional regulator n=1 Tax=Curtobacterium sp. 1P10AnD TaxID=3132283 RepID=UPI0039A14759
MNRTDRLYALVEALRAVAPRPLSARRLAERFEVSVRTVERDLSALQQAGVPIWAEPGRTGGYCLDREHTLAPLGLTADEALAVTVGLGVLATGPFRDAAASALGKVHAATRDERLAESLLVARRIAFLEPDEDTPARDVVATALRGGQVLRLRYRDRDGELSDREVEPLGYVVRDGVWYLVAWCRLRRAVRAFRATRIESLEPIGEHAPLRPFDAADLDIPHGTTRHAVED